MLDAATYVSVSLAIPRPVFTLGDPGVHAPAISAFTPAISAFTCR